MRPHVKATIDDLDAEIRRLTDLRDGLMRLEGTPEPATTVSTSIRTTVRRPAKSAAAPKRPAKKPGAKPAEKGTLTESQTRIARFLDKSGPSDLKTIAAGIKAKTAGPVARSLGVLAELGFVVESDGFHRLTDKGVDAALA